MNSVYIALEYIQILPTPTSATIKFYFPGEVAVKRYTYIISEVDRDDGNFTGGQVNHNTKTDVSRKHSWGGMRFFTENYIYRPYIILLETQHEIKIEMLKFGYVWYMILGTMLQVQTIVTTADSLTPRTRYLVTIRPLKGNTRSQIRARTKEFMTCKTMNFQNPIFTFPVMLLFFMHLQWIYLNQRI